MKKLTVLCMSASACLVGCIPPLIALPLNTDEQVSAAFLEPKVGEVARCEIGESMIRSGLAVTTKKSTITILDDAYSSMDLGHNFKAPAGASRPLKLRADNGLPLFCLPTTGVMANGGVEGCLVDTNKTGVFNHAMFSMRDKYFPLAAPVRYKIDTKQQKIEDTTSFRIDVLYQGLSKGEVKISYREFSGGIARPAFTQDVSYELEKDGTALLAFKGMRVKVVKATKQDITYILERPPTN